jgi:hypothetical protein
MTRTSLLVLDARDLHVLMEREPRIAERIREVVRTRVGRDIVTPEGDLVLEEIEEGDSSRPPARIKAGIGYSRRGRNRKYRSRLWTDLSARCAKMTNSRPKRKKIRKRPRWNNDDDD